MILQMCAADVLFYAFLNRPILKLLIITFSACDAQSATRVWSETSDFRLIIMALEFNFPIECLEDVLDHLSGKDLLVCTLVCPDWNNFIGSTTSCMKKIKLKCLSYDHSQVKKEKIFMNKSRKYKCLELSQDHSEQLTGVLLPIGGTLAQVTLDMHFQTANHFLSFLEIFQSSVQLLDILEVTVGETEIRSTASVKSPDLQFP